LTDLIKYRWTLNRYYAEITQACTGDEVAPANFKNSFLKWPHSSHLLAEEGKMRKP
jgi:hypothetical protein